MLLVPPRNQQAGGAGFREVGRLHGKRGELLILGSDKVTHLIDVAPTDLTQKGTR